MAQQIDKYPNLCYYCQLQEIRARIEAEGGEVHLRPSLIGTGVDVVKRMPGVDEPIESKEGWFPAIPDHCVC